MSKTRIRREEYDVALKYFDSCYEYTKNNLKPSLFTTVAPVGRGKSQMVEQLIEDITYKRKDSKHVVKFDFKEKKLTEDRYCSLAICATITGIILQYLKNEQNDEDTKKLIDSCKNVLKLYNTFCSEIQLNKQISLSKSDTRKVANETFETVLSLGEAAFSTFVTIANPIGGIFAGLGIAKTKEFLIEGFKSISFNGIIEDEFRNKNISFFDVLDAKNPEASAIKLENKFIRLLAKCFTYFKEDPFFVIIDNAESLNYLSNSDTVTFDRNCFKELFSIEAPVVWYTSGRSIPYDIDKSFVLNKSYYGPIELSLLNNKDIEALFKLRNIKIDECEPTDLDIEKIKNKTEGNIYWISMYLLDLLSIQEEEDRDYVTKDEYSKCINKSKEEIIKRMLGCDFNDESDVRNNKNRILFGMLPTCSWNVFEQIANVSGIENDVKTQYELCSTNTSESYGVHAELDKYSKIVLKKSLQENSFVANVINKIIDNTRVLFINNQVEDNYNEYFEPFMLMVTRLYDYKHIIEILEPLKQIKIGESNLHSLYHKNIANQIFTNTEDIEFVDLMLKGNKLSKYQKIQYLFKVIRKNYLEEEIKNENDLNKIEEVYKEILNVTQDEGRDLYLDELQMILDGNIAFLKQQKSVDESVIFEGYIDSRNVYYVTFKANSFDFVTNSSEYCLTKMYDLDHSRYLKYKEEYFEQLNRIIEAVDSYRFIEEANKSMYYIECFDYDKNNYENFEEFLQNKAQEIKSEDIELIFFHCVDELIFRLTKISYSSDKTKEITEDLFKTALDKYFEIDDVRQRKNRSFFIKTFGKYMNNKYISQQTEQLLLNSIYLDGIIDRNIINILFDYYNIRREDEKIIDLFNNIYENIYPNFDESNMDKSFLVKILQDNNASLTTALIRCDYIETTMLKRYADNLRNLRKNEQKNNFIYAYIYIENTTKTALTYEIFEPLLNLYFSCALFSPSFYIKPLGNGVVAIRKLFNDYETKLPEIFKTNEAKFHIFDYIHYIKANEDKLPQQECIKTMYEEYRKQIKLEDTLLLAIAYLLRTKNQKAINTTNTIRKVIKKTIYEYIDIHINKHNGYFVDSIKQNIYRKLINLEFILDVFSSCFDNQYDRQQKSQLLVKSLHFDYNNVLNKDDYLCETLNIEDTIRHLYEDNNELKLYTGKLFIESLKEYTQEDTHNGLMTDKKQYVQEYFAYLANILTIFRQIGASDDEYCELLLNEYIIGNIEKNNYSNYAHFYLRMIADISTTNKTEDITIKALNTIAQKVDDVNKHYIYRKIAEINYSLNAIEDCVDYMKKSIECRRMTIKKDDISVISNLYSRLVNFVLDSEYKENVKQYLEEEKKTILQEDSLYTKEIINKINGLINSLSNIDTTNE